MNIATLSLTAIFAAGAAGFCGAQELKATQRFTETQIGFDPSGNYSNYTLTVTGPNGFQATSSSKTGTPAIDLRRFGTFDDGVYHYQLSASSGEKATLRTPLDNGRGDSPAGTGLKGVSLSGQFAVKGGTILKVDPNAREQSNKRAN